MNPTLKPIPRAIIYTRVSSGKQVEGTSLESQLEACEKKAAQLGATVVGRHKDPGVSGGLYAARPGMQAALRQLEAGEADMLITAKLDRYSRDREHQAAIKKRVEVAGARLIFCDMHFEATPEGDLAFSILGDFAEYERKVIRERTMRGNRKRAEEGIQPCRSLSPFGYHVVTKEDVLKGLYPPGTQGTYQVLQEQARWIPDIFSRYAAGDSLRTLARWLNSSHVTLPQRGKIWRPTTLKRIVENPVYKGLAVFGRTQTVTDETRIAAGFKHPTMLRPAPESNRVYINAPTLIDEQTWAACNERLRTGRAMYGGRPSRKHMLSGLLKCPACHRGMGGVLNTKRAGGKLRVTPMHTYQCKFSRSANIYDGNSCDRTTYRAEVAESLTVKAIQAIAQRPELTAAAIEEYQQSTATAYSDVEHNRLKKELRDLEAQEKATVQAQIAGIQSGANPAIYETLLQGIAAQRDDLKRQMQAMEAQRRQPTTNARAAAEIAQEWLADVADFFEAPDVTPAQKHDVLARVVESIYPEGEGYRIKLKPFFNGADTQTVTYIGAC